MKTGVSVELLGKGCFPFSFFFLNYLFLGIQKDLWRGQFYLTPLMGWVPPPWIFNFLKLVRNIDHIIMTVLTTTIEVLLFDNEKNYETAFITPKECNFIFTINGGWTFWWFGDNASHSYTI